MKRDDPKLPQRINGLLAWPGKTLEQWERAKTRRKDERKRDQMKKAAKKS